MKFLKIISSITLIVLLISSLSTTHVFAANTNTETVPPSIILDGVISPGQSPGILFLIGWFTFASGSSYQVEIGGTSPGSNNNNHDQIDVTGTVTIDNNVSLNTVSWNGYTPTDGASYTIINNDGSDAVTGTFSGLPEGGIITNFLGSGLYATITYAGGDGNDVVLTAKQYPPDFTKAFSPNPILSGSTSTLTFTIDNTGSASTASSLDFTDNLPTGMTIATPANAISTCTGGTLTANAGTSIITYTGGTVSAGADCTLSVDITSSTSGSNSNTTGDLTSSLGNSGTASDDLIVNLLPAFAKLFTPDTIGKGGVSTLTFTIDNTGSASTASSLDFTDNLPTGMTIASPANASTTCTGGTLTASAGTSAVAYTGGAVNASSACTLSVDITSSSNGIHSNTTGNLTSSLGNSGTASDDLTVDAFHPTITKTDIVTSYTTGPISFTATLSENVANPAGDTGQDDVTNPGNYLLIQAGPNTTYDTPSCIMKFNNSDTVLGDDIQIPTGTVTYDANTFTATVTLNNGTPLPDGDYRLFLCGTTSIVDLATNPLNDGVDSIYDFTVDSTATTTTPSSLPATGFRHGKVIAFPEQPAAKAYTETAMTLEIPKLGVNMPIVGVPQTENGWDVTWLGNSAGYLAGSAFPTWAGNTVITGHVWDSFNQPGAFAEIKSLKYGDQVQIQAWGLTYTYEVRESKLVTVKNVDAAFQSETYDWVTLVTCEFYNPFSGDYLFRRAVRAVLVSVK
ncbi:MAG: sortase [Chloroflexi bacterium]|nr:sortase [Chloroflexota bacterium]